MYTRTDMIYMLHRGAHLQVLLTVAALGNTNTQGLVEAESGSRRKRVTGSYSELLGSRPAAAQADVQQAATNNGTVQFWWV